MNKSPISFLNAFLKTVKESQVSKDCKELLDLNGLPNWRNNVLKGWFRAYNEPPGKERAVDTGTAGLSDRSTILPDGRTLYIETKRPKGEKQSQEQIGFEKMCIDNNAPYICVRSWLELAEYLDILGYLKVRIQ